MATLELTLTDYVDDTRWRWVLTDSQGGFLADHEVHLDPTSRETRGLQDVSTYLDYHQPIAPQEAQLAQLGTWIGQEVFGGLRAALRERASLPATAVRVSLPEAADALLLRPFELARFADGTLFRQAGIRFVYHIEGAPDPSRAKRPAGETLRILAAFSLPVDAKPLNLRRERYGLQQLVRRLRQTRGAAVELRALQYGATRAILEDALEEGAGWDVVHLSGHGLRGELLLEDEWGDVDRIQADELGDLLAPAGTRLKLLILDACYSGAGDHAAARAQLGLDPGPTRREEDDEAPPQVTETRLPSLAQALSRRLDCAALAMRYPVGDAFATDLMLALYEKLLERRCALPAALHLALDDVLADDGPRPPLSPTTPILVGPRAADLDLAPPQRPAGRFTLPQVGLSIAFPQEPERFVGRLRPMLRASQALAPRSDQRGVLFYGMPGAGKTACALELAYRHAEGRFQGYVWYRAPEAGSEVAGELFNLLFEIERQLNAPDLGLTTALDQPERFRRFTLPRLKALLQQYSLLLVLDNLETLLTASNRWRDPLWGDVMAALLGHAGPSRVVLTSRRRPADLEAHPRLAVEAIHALSLAESVLLARELPHLGRLFHDQGGRALLQETLRVVQGHPKLLELADALAVDRAALAERVAAAADELDTGADVLDAFFAAEGSAAGESQQDEAGFVQALRGWTERLMRGLRPPAGLLLAFLCRMEPEDRESGGVEANWGDFLKRLGDEHPVAAAARETPERGLGAALNALEGAGLVAVKRETVDPGQMAGLEAALAELAGQAGVDLDPDAVPGLLARLAAQATYTIHPGVAEAVRAAAEPAVLDAVDVELGDYHIARYQQARKREMEGGGGMVATSARRAAPYLMRQARWEEAATLLERMLARDSSPASLAFALPLLRRIAEDTAGTERELIDAGVLAKALWMAGQVDEAERMMRDRIQRCVAQGNFRLASVAAGTLINILISSGRLAEALEAAEEMVTYTRQAGLGPWTLLLDEAMRLQILAAMGRYDEVLEAVEDLRGEMEALPLESPAEEAVDPWNVRETLLETGHTAGLYSGRWERALALNSEVVKFKRARGANALELARARFNDYGPLLRLGRTVEARRLLLDCRAVFEEERDLAGLGKVYSALANLEHETGGRDEAVGFEEVALRYEYQAGQPEDCAISHHNLAGYLARQDADPAAVLAHRLAAALVFLQTQSGHLGTVLGNLAKYNLPPAPPSFETVVERVEAVEGVRFRALFQQLPRTAPDGDAAIAAVWQLVAEEKDRVLHEFERVLRDFEPLLRDIAAAVDNEGKQAEIEALLPRLEEKGWRLTDPVHRIWAGERDAAALTADIDPNSAQLVRRILELLEG